MNKKGNIFLTTIEVILLETYTFVIETKQLYNGRNRKYYNSRYSSRSGDGAYSGYLAHALCLSGICRLKYNGEERELRAGDLMIVRKGKLVEKNSTFRRFSRKGHLYRIGLCGAEYTTEQLRHRKGNFPYFSILSCP